MLPAASSAPEPATADQPITLPPLPGGLERDIRAHLGALLQLHGGKGHVLLRIDLKPKTRTSWEITSGGRGEEPGA